MQSLLIIGYVWPEPTATAAGTRMLQLIEQFNRLKFNITFACAATKPKTAFNLNKLGVVTQEIELNNVSFDVFLKKINPTVVLFDRFMIEEQFGWRVLEQCPDALRLLDSEDLHFLRKAREQSVKNGENLPKGFVFSDDAKREIASIYRCDATLTISEYEITYLKQVYQIPEHLLWYLPFLVEPDEQEKPGFEQRQDFVFIGNFIHAPNWDAVLQLKQHIWPLLKKQVPKAKLHIYGGYPSEKVFQLHNEQQNFLVHGRADNVQSVMQKAKVCLAPLRFGAGLKGKLIDAVQNKTPFVTSSIGAEGMFGTNHFKDSIADDVDAFVTKAKQLYLRKDLWIEQQKKGTIVLKEKFAKDLFEDRFKDNLFFLLKYIKEHRSKNFIGAMLQHHSLKSSMYLSKWIEEKNKV